MIVEKIIKYSNIFKTRTNLASKARAQIPAAKGALAEVPVCLFVHELCRSVVT